MGPRFRRGTLVGILAIGAASLLLVAALLHAGPVRARVLRGVLARLHAAGVEARADALDYNLFSLEFRARNVALGRVGLREAPFLRADEIAIDLPWSILGGGLAFERITLVRPRLTIITNGDGSTNLPISTPGRASAAGPPRPIRIRHLDLRDLAVRWSDGTRATNLDVPGLSLALAPDGDVSSGRLRLSGSASFSRGGQKTSVAGLDGTVAFDGSFVSLAAFRVDTPEARVALDGRIGPVLSTPAIDLSFRASLALDRLGPWLGVSGPVSGRLECRGGLRGPATDPGGWMEIAGREIGWATLRGAAIDGRIELTSAAADIRSLVLRAAGGQLSFSGRFPRAGAGPKRVAGAWRDLDAAVLLRALAPGIPVVPAGRLEGRVDATWERFDPASLTITAENRSDPGPGDSARGLAGRLALRSEAGRWTLALDQQIGAAHVGGSAIAVASSDAWRAATLGGEVNVETDDLARTWELIAAGFLPASARPAAPGGEVHANIRLAGTLGSPRFVAAVDGGSLRLGAWGPARAVAHVSGSPDEVHVESAEVTLGGNHARASGQVNIASGRLALDVDAALSDLPSLTAGLPSGMRPEGQVRATATARGTWSALALRGDISATDVRIAGQVADRLTAAVRLERGVLIAERLAVRQGAGELVATGHYDLRRSAYSVDAHGRGLTLSSTSGSGPNPVSASDVPFGAGIDVDFSGSGSFDRPQGAGRLVLTRMAWGGRPLGGAEIDIELADRVLRADGTAAELGLRVGGRLGLSGGRFHLDAALAHDVGALATRLLAEPHAALSGAIAARLHGDGTLHDPAASTAELDLDRLDATVNGNPLRLNAPAVVRYANGRLEAGRVDLQLGASQLTVEGQLQPGGSDVLSASLIGRLEDLAAIESLLPDAVRRSLREVNPGGAIALTATAAGPFACPRLEATLAVDGARANLPGLPPLAGLNLRARYQDGVLGVERLEGTWQQARFDVSGRVPAKLLASSLPREYVASLPPEPATARVSARLSGISPAALAPFVGDSALADVQGALAADVSLEADRLSVDGVRGTATLATSDTVVAGVPLTQRSPARLTIAAGRIELADWAWTGGGTRIALGGDVRVTPEPTMDLDAEGQVDLRLVNAFVRDIAAGGRAQIKLGAHGPAAAPAIAGSVMLDRGELRLASLRMAVTGISGRLTLTPDAISFADIRGTANGGEIQLSGEVLYHGVRPTGGRVSMAGRGIGVELGGLVGEVDANLDLGFAPDRLALTGTLVAARSAYRQPLALAAGLLPSGSRASTAGAPPASWLDRTSLDIRATTADDLVVDNNYARVDVGANLRLVGTLGRPSIVGRATVREGGRVYLGGNVYRLADPGSVDFSNRERIQPRFDLSAVTRVQGHDITLAIKGTPETLETDLHSDDALGKADLVSLLLTGRTAADARSLPPSAAGQQLLGLLSGEFLGLAGRAVGLDALRIQRGLPDVQFGAGLIATEADPGARLTFAKNLGSSVEVIFSQALSESGKQTWIVSYRPMRNFEVRGVSSDQGDRSYELRHDLSFGGAARPSSLAAGPGARVAAVVFGGRPRFGQAELGRQVKLSAGDRFDLRRWQDDRDRLEAFYHRSGYLEARIVAVREAAAPVAAAAASVTLRYDIRTGPQTALVVEGFPLPESVTGAMRDAWTRAVLDQSLVADLETLARTYLTGQGYLRSTVKASLDTTPGRERKRAVVHVEPGPRSARRRVEFQGNAQIPAKRLRAWLRPAPAGAEAWTDAARLCQHLEAVYRDEGFLNVAVRARPIEFRGDEAVRVLDIAEGPAYRVSTVQVRGARRLDEGTLLSGVGLKAGDLYVRSRVASALGEIQRRYQRSGFREATAEETAEVRRPAASVAVTFVVSEGPQHVVREVTVEGDTRTDRRLIGRLLALDIGQPVDVSRWAEARSRLYDTGVFRSVDIEDERLGGSVDQPGGAEQPVRARVTLADLPPLRLRYGLQVRDEHAPASEQRAFGAGVSADLGYKNLFRRAAAVGISAEATKDLRDVRGYLTFPSVGGWPLGSNLFVSRSRQAFRSESAQPYVADILDFTAEQRIRRLPALEIAYGYNFQRNHSYDLHADPDNPLAFDLTVNVARFNITVLHDSRDDLLDATRGVFHSSSLAYAAERLGSDVRFVKYVLQQSYYRPLARRLVLAASGRLGLSKGFGQEIIPSERFYAGGGTSVRGYADDALGPLDFLGDPAGGNALVIVNGELRFPIASIVRGVAFFDAGSAFPRVSDVSIRDLRTSTGVGLRLATPVGLVRVDLGVPLGRRPGEARTRWFFGLGQLF